MTRNVLLSLLAVCLGVSYVQTAPMPYNPADVSKGTIYCSDDTDSTKFWMIWGTSQAQFSCSAGTCADPNYGCQVATATNNAVNPCSFQACAFAGSTGSASATNEQVYCNLEQGLCGTWKIESTSNYKFTSIQGRDALTRTHGTGPNGDKSFLANGFYLFAEANDGVFATHYDQKTSLNLGGMTGSVQVVLEFWYHVTGANFNQLRVFIRRFDNKQEFDVWKITGTTPQGTWTGNDWKQVQVAIPSGISGGYELLIEATSPTAFSSDEGDIALDNIEVRRDRWVYGNCSLLRDQGSTLDGLYYLMMPVGLITHMWCDMVNGMPVMLRRCDGSVNFNRPWTDYVLGFHSGSEYWIGLDNLNRITNSGLFQLDVDLTDWNNQTFYAHYSSINVGDASTDYTLNLGPYLSTTSTAFDGLNAVFPAAIYSSYASNTMKFSTYDKDNDKSPYSCSELHQAGWWFQDCSVAVLTAPYSQNQTCWIRCINWLTLGSRGFRKVEMKLHKL